VSEQLHLKYRPKSFDEVIGHKAVKISLRKVVELGVNRTFLFVGPSGIGKTTLARLVAKAVGCSLGNVLELDAATNTGIDNMRELMERLQYRAVDGGPRCVILDEVHALSKPAFQSLLKILEEPPADIYWCLCTTEGDKVPKQVQTRCTTYALKPVDEEIIHRLLVEVWLQEKLTVPGDYLRLISEASEGSPRQALVYLGACGHLKKRESIEAVLALPTTSSPEAIDLCRLLLRNARWPEVAKALKTISGNAEGTRLVVLAYMNTVALSGGPKASTALRIMRSFSMPFLDREGKAPLTIACAKLYTGGK
jgi:DNA polymerase-3 subunit gamma/tau